MTTSSSLFSSMRRGASLPAATTTRSRGGTSRSEGGAPPHLSLSPSFRKPNARIPNPSPPSTARATTTTTTARAFFARAPTPQWPSAACAAAAAAGRRPSPSRARLAAAASSRNDQQQAEAEAAATAELQEAVERAAASLDELLQQVLNDCVAEQAASFLRSPGTGAGGNTDNNNNNTDNNSWPSADTLEGIVRGAVAQRVEWLDDAFLVALDAYARAIDARMRSSKQRPSAAANADQNDDDDDARLLDVLLLVRREVLAQVSSRLPATVQVLDAALRETEASRRLQVVERALGGGGGGLPGVSFDALASTAGQLVDDMEDAEAVPDRALLARLVLLREELRAMHARREYVGGGGGGGNDGNGGNGNGGGAAVFGFHRSNLPRACAAFAKELVAVGDGNRRAALLAKAFEEDWTGGAGSKEKSGGEATSGGGGFGNSASSAKTKQQRKEAPDVVRPGRFLATVHAMSGELEARLRQQGEGAGAGAEADGQASSTAAVLRRLDEVRMEAVAVLDRMQRRGGSFGGGGPSSR